MFVLGSIYVFTRQEAAETQRLSALHPKEGFSVRIMDGDIRIIPEIEAPGQLGVLFGIGDVDARSPNGIQPAGVAAAFQPERAVRAVNAKPVQAPVDPERLRQLAWPS
ncbi:hypothetical protein D3C73_1196120 [compost metagenome]